MKDLIVAIFNIFKYVGKFFTLIRNTLFNLLLLAIIIVIIISYFSKSELEIANNSILRLDISGNIVEEKKNLSPFEKYMEEQFFADSRQTETLLQDIIDIIDAGREDNRISVLLLNLKNMGGAGMNQLTRIGRALEEFKQAGKKVISAEDFYSQSQYYLASYSDHIGINPMGAVDLHGFGVYRLYFKDGVDKLKVNYNIFRVGSFKSALEPFTRNNMSPEDKNQNSLWLTSLWENYTSRITKNRDIPLTNIKNYTNNIEQGLRKAQGSTARLAFNTGLVDEIWTRQEINNHLAKLTNRKNKKLSVISSAKYFSTITPSYSNGRISENKIGLIVAEGNILPGKQPQGTIGGDSLAKLIKRARNNNDIKALVLRINSGGGSAFASEVIRQELLEFQKSDKPVVVSMGSVTASGGYWIAANADEIWASESTITGSIGVFGAIPTFENTLADLGVYSDGTGTTPLAAGLNLTRPLPESLKQAIQLSVSQNYSLFLDIVANGRDIEKSRVEELAQGRIYDGRTAQGLGLVDKLGNLDEAILSAGNLAGLDLYETEYIQPQTSVRDQVMKYFTTSLNVLSKMTNSTHSLADKLHAEIINQASELIFLDDPNHIFAHCLVRPVI